MTSSGTGRTMSQMSQMSERGVAVELDQLHRTPPSPAFDLDPLLPGEPSLSDPRFESLLLRLHVAIDIPGFWSALRSILDEVVPNDPYVAYRDDVDLSRMWNTSADFSAREMALLNRLHPRIATSLRRLAAADDRIEFRGVRIAPQALFGQLTPAERELVCFVREGWSNKEIAARLDKSVRTVKTQLTSVYKKFRVRGRSRLLALMRQEESREALGPGNSA